MKLSQAVFDCYVGTAMGCFLLAIFIWCTLFKKVHRGVWFTIFTGMILVVFHCLGYFVNSVYLSQSTALSNAILALFAVLVTRRNFKRLDAERASYETQIAKKSSVAEELTKVLNAYKTEIEYYEQQARERDFPVFKERRVRF